MNLNTFQKFFLKELDYFSALFPEQCKAGYVIYAGHTSQNIGWRMLLNYQSVREIK